MKYFLLFLLALSFRFGFAQQSRRDSLENLLMQAGPDTNRTILLNTVVGHYFSSNPQKVKEYADEAMQLSRQLSYQRGIGRSYISYGTYFLTQGQYQQAIDSLNLALPYFEALNDQDGIAKVYSNIGLNLRSLGDFPQATTYLFKSLRVFEKTGNQAAAAKAFNSIALIFKDQEKYDQALYYNWQSFRKNAGISPRDQAGALLNIGQVYQLKKEYNSALKYISQARKRFAALNEPLGLIICDNNSGSIYLKMKQYDRAEKSARHALEAATRLGYVPNTATSLLLMGDIRLQTGRARESLAFFDSVYVLMSKGHQQESLINVYKGRADAYAQIGDFAKAYYNQGRWMNLKDSLLNAESTQKVARVQASYETEKKQTELELLKKAQQVADLWRNSIGSGLLAMLIIAGLVVSRQRLKIRKDTVLLAQSELVAHKNEQLETQTNLLEGQAAVLTTQAHKLRALDEAKTRFFTNVTHEFRTPLTLIMGTLSEKMHNLTDQTDALIGRAEVSVMYRNAQRLLHLINQLLDLSKIESGQLALSLKPGDLKPLLSVSAALFSSLADQRQIRLTLNVPPEELGACFDADQLEIVVTNLMSNAFKFTPDGGKISLSAERVEVGEQMFVKIRVSDTGIGVLPEQTDLIFERFYQGSNPRHDRQPGTGIGLSLVKEIVQLHQGTIHIEPRPGPGTCFVVLLPVAALDPEPGALPLVAKQQDIEQVFSVPEAGSAEPSLLLFPTTDDRPLLLVVEDNEDVRGLISHQMQAHYRVIESEDGLTGLAMARQTMPDLIISDWMMPDMNGLELCHQIKTDERTSHIPFVLLTALSAHDERLKGLETGADDYLTKPFDARELRIRVQNLIASRRQLHERFSQDIRIQPGDISITSADEKFLARVMAIVETNMGNADFTAEQFGRDAGLSRMQLHRKLVAMTGQSASDFIRLMRLKRAAQLLDGQAGNVSETAYSVGFNSLSYFAKCFREQFGASPHEYQERLNPA